MFSYLVNSKGREGGRRWRRGKNRREKGKKREKGEEEEGGEGREEEMGRRRGMGGGGAESRFVWGRERWHVGRISIMWAASGRGEDIVANGAGHMAARGKPAGDSHSSVGDVRDDARDAER